jgi:sialate O-acetylesterase
MNILKKRNNIFLVLCLLLTAIQTVNAETTAASLFSEGMVIQRDKAVKVWGWDEPGTLVTLSLRQQKQCGETDKEGRWEIELAPVKAGGPYVMAIEGTSKIVINDIMAGEVWIASGQSNMHWEMYRTMNAEQELARAECPCIRLYHVPRKGAENPLRDSGGKWVSCTPDNVKMFSAVGYFFVKNLHENLNVPVGLINCNWGGSTAEAWVSEQTLRSDPEFLPILNAAPDIEKPYRVPSALYNGMLQPIIPFAAGGVIWYQGEGNDHRAWQYRKLFPALIQEWRNEWNRDKLPFLYVQLANYDTPAKRAPAYSWAELREVQLKTLEKVENTAMAVTIDIGEGDSIHPLDKQEVGKRLSLAAMAKVYGSDIEYSGPIYKSMKIDEDKIILSFDHVGKGLKVKGKALQGFQIAADNMEFVEALAEINNDKVVVSSDSISHPKAVRYAWKNNPENANLYNNAGLPASPFRTDDLPYVTKGQLVPRK